MTLEQGAEHKVYGLVGHPLGHSFSRDFFTRKFAAEYTDAEYLNFDIEDISRLKDIIATHKQLSGFNVTIPYKQAVMPLLTSLSSEAATVGAVNVVKVVRHADGGDVRLEGYNSDVFGFVNSLKPMLSGGCHSRALVLGTGGASRAVVHGLKSLGITPVAVSRTPESEHLKDYPSEVISYGDLSAEIVRRMTVIVNATPVGMYPAADTCPPIPYDAVTGRHVCFDLVYNPTDTRFMQRCAARGARVKNGLEMLHLQALRAYEIWTHRVTNLSNS